MASGLTTDKVEPGPVATALSKAETLHKLRAATQSLLARRSRGLSKLAVVAEAEEIVAEACIRALKRQDAYQAGTNVVAWLVGFVNNVIREHLKKGGRMRNGPPGTAATLESLASDICRPIDAVLDQEQSEQLADYLALLSETDRELIRQRYNDGLTFAQIAAARGENSNSVRVRVHRLLIRLREQFGAAGEEQA